MALKCSFLPFKWKIFVLLSLIYVQSVTSLWEYAIATKQNIILYDGNWNEVTEAASSKLKNLKALTYDTTHDVFYFTDRHDDHTYINTLKIRNDGTPVITSLIELTEKEYVEDLVYDFNDDILFFSDKENKRIVEIIFDRTNPENVTWRKEIFIEIKTGTPTGLELDACKRVLYYTVVDLSTRESSINAISIQEKRSEIICKTCKHHRPLAIALDEKNDRIYIADNLKSNVYVINSFTSNSDDLTLELKSFDRTPRSLAIDHEYVYYLDGKEHTLRRLKKNHAVGETSEFLIKFTYDPTDIIVRTNFIDAIRVDLSKCHLTKERMEELQKVNQRIKMEEVVCEKASINKLSKSCLHGGEYDENTMRCMCKELRYDGDHCEIDLCYNFCLNGGECSMEKNIISTKVLPSCSCTKGFIGERCEIDACSNYCMNGGKCSINNMRKPICECVENFKGERCENDHEIETKIIPTSSIAIENNESDTKILSKCPVRMNLTYVILSMCVTLSLLFFLIILLVIRRFHKPMRPKIRKKYVVHKNIEPLQCRPTTEQCEVIIEDCCNMNICDTPCFDPKILQQEINEANIKVKLTSSKKCKDDKQNLLKNMEINQ
ncbi:hypothetical protein PVAND_010446 [Polypedilum vanderplanki]|uniref:EGF-like domain-containing protein n=1 Tax=Polypedilum vanderplanki TaxID=319348 RepID=A0A9J6CFY0_POLVA|nr:hypothetical protein PVAND_010446 [Polypedilum vanderplanki]